MQRMIMAANIYETQLGESHEDSKSDVHIQMCMRDQKQWQSAQYIHKYKYVRSKGMKMNMNYIYIYEIRQWKLAHPYVYMHKSRIMTVGIRWK